ncbi:unnamed protein product [Fusarium venenatum]|uniref:Uncharacterized protein n=1 Tax=Fusarium venenatum TaxID=56646 RepID=A0A2L2SXR8_9HYPO|nr:uncharacterized protein FVRRES_05965 [Fusarium venenatum]CEI61529.1 unnamed protein product [Fusarium venenatum]
MRGATSRQENQTTATLSSVVAFIQHDRRYVLKQKLGKNKDCIRTFTKHVRDLLDETEIYHKHVPREDWKDMDLLESLLEKRSRHLNDLWATRRRLENEMREIRREVRHHLSWTSPYPDMNQQQRIDRVSRVIKGSRISSSHINSHKLQPLTTQLSFTHYCSSMPKSAEITNTYPQMVEYVYVYTVEMKREIESISAEIRAIKAGLRLRDAELQHDIARMKLQIEQMRRSQT